MDNSWSDASHNVHSYGPAEGSSQGGQPLPPPHHQPQASRPEFDRPFILQEALPYTPFSSIAPFDSSELPLSRPCLPNTPIDAAPFPPLQFHLILF